MLKKKNSSPRKVRPLPIKKPHLKWERQLFSQGFDLIAGLDEVGRGAWAGPLLAAAVILPLGMKQLFRLGIRDSKTLPPLRRQELCDKIKQIAKSHAVGQVSVRELNLLGLGKATKLAMERAIRGLLVKPQFILVDGYPVKFKNIPSQGVIDGDRSSLSIAAASIVAKVTRDHLMIEQGRKLYPAYRFELHKGYGTKLHQKILAEQGICPWHRQQFRPIELLKQTSSHAG